MNRNYGVDLMRLIGSFAVILVHTGYGELDTETVYKIRLFGRWAVPFFFMTTGFFLSKKISDSGERLSFGKIERNIIQLISIHVVSSFVFLLVNMYLGRLTFQVSNILVGTYFHLWFIGSLIFGYIIIWYLYKINKQKLLPILSVIVIGMALVADSYDIVLRKDVNFDLYRFLISIPFMYLGIWIGKSNIKFPGKMVLLLIAIVGMGIQIMEAHFLYQWFNYSPTTHQFIVGSIVMTIPLFLLGLKLNLKKNRFSKWGRDYSLFIYLYHPLVFFFLNIILKNLFPEDFDNIEMFYPILGFVLSLLIAIGLDKYIPKAYRFLNGNIYSQ